MRLPSSCVSQSASRNQLDLAASVLPEGANDQNKTGEKSKQWIYNAGQHYCTVWQLISQVAD